jgi:hypothetical protein
MSSLGHGVCAKMDSGHVPIAAVLGITVIAAAFSALGRLLVLERGDDRPGIWNVFAIGPDLIVGAVVAVPSLLVGRNATLSQYHRVLQASATANASWNPSGLIVLMIIFLFGLGVACERLWAKQTRQRDGWKDPVLKGIIPPALCGFAAIGAALALGSP